MELADVGVFGFEEDDDWYLVLWVVNNSVYQLSVLIIHFREKMRVKEMKVIMNCV